MKVCNWCGNKYPDTSEVCAVDGKPLDFARERSPLPDTQTTQIGAVDSAQEERFWRQMNFRRFAALILRIQALWLLFYALIDVTYLLPYLRPIAGERLISSVASQLGFDLFLMILRIALYVGAALAIIQNAERFLSWLVKDWIKKQPSEDDSPPPPA